MAWLCAQSVLAGVFLQPPILSENRFTVVAIYAAQKDILHVQFVMVQKNFLDGAMFVLEQDKK